MKIFKILSVFCFTVFVICGCSKKTSGDELLGEIKKKGEMVIATEGTWAPWTFHDEKDMLTGFDIEVARKIAEKIGVKANFVEVEWDGIFAGLTTDRYDVVMSAATITPERQAAYDFSQPYIGNGQALILQKDSTLPWNKPEDAAGKKIGYQAETTSDFFIEKYAAAHNFEFIPCEYDKVMNAYDDLKFGRIDCVVSDNLVSVSYLNVPDSEFKRVWTGTPDEYFGVCMKQGNKVLQDKINKAIDDMKADGTMAKIYIKIFGEDLSDSIK